MEDKATLAASSQANPKLALLGENKSPGLCPPPSQRFPVKQTLFGGILLYLLSDEAQSEKEHVILERI